MYEQIKNDEHIKNLFVTLANEEQKADYFLAYHSKVHIMNVVSTVEKVLTSLGYDEDMIESAKIAAILHDMGVIYGKEGHARKSYEMAKQYFEDNNIDTGNNDMILDAILHHSNGFERNNPIASALIFADKIDIKKDRIARDGYNDIGMRQLQYIEDIDIFIDKQKKELMVNFILDDKANKKELEGFYFIEKVFKAIEGFAAEHNLIGTVLYNNESWCLEKPETRF